MEKIIVIWGRNLDNAIGYDKGKFGLPWDRKIKDDLPRFKRITENQNVILGSKTYNGLPNKTLPNRKLFILTNQENFELSDKKNHQTISLSDIPNIKGDIYVAGGGQIYDLFLYTDELQPDFIVDCDLQESIEDRSHSVENGYTYIKIAVAFMENEYVQYLIRILDNMHISIYAHKRIPNAENDPTFKMLEKKILNEA